MGMASPASADRSLGSATKDALEFGAVRPQRMPQIFNDLLPQSSGLE